MGIRSMAAATLPFLLMAGTARAAGDAPRRMTAKEAADYHGWIRPLLTNDGEGCPLGQVPLSGAIVGGAAPEGGVQTITLAFDKGATVVVSKSWNRSDRVAAVEMRCSQDPIGPPRAFGRGNVGRLGAGPP